MTRYPKYKLILSIAIIAITFCTPYIIFAQKVSMEQTIESIQDLLVSVEANKLTYNQELKAVGEGYYDYTVQEVNSKGNENTTTYTFAFSDINTNSVKYFTKRDVILIELTVTGQQKLIKRSSDNGEKVDYVSSITLYGLNADNGRALEEEIEKTIPEAIKLSEESFVLQSYNQHLSWLENNLKNVTLSKRQIAQHLTAEPTIPGFVILEQMPSSKMERFEFNLAQLNPVTLSYNISGDEFLVEIRTKKGASAIKYFVDDIHKGYTDKVSFYASSLANGKLIHKVLKGISPLANDAYNNSKPVINSVTSAVDYLNSHMNKVESDDRTTSQRIALDKNMITVSSKEVVSDKTENHTYYLNLTDINENGIEIKDKKTRLYLIIKTTKGTKYIGHSLNGTTENFEEELFLYFNSFEEAAIAKEALQYLIVHFKDISAATDSTFRISLNDAMTELNSTLETVKGSNYLFEQKIDFLETETTTFKFSKTASNDKKNTENIFEFSAQDLSQHNSKVQVSGKRVWTEVTLRSDEKLVKVYEDGEVQNYENKVEIEASSIENAKHISSIFNRLAASLVE